MCGTNYAKNAHATSIGIPVGYEEAGRVYYQVWVNLRNGTKRERERVGGGGAFQNGNNDYTALWYQFVPGHDGA